MGDNEQKALQLMADAEKKLTASKGFFGSLFGCVVKFYSFSLIVFLLICICISIGPIYDFTI